MATKKQSIESYAQQISNQTNQMQYAEMTRMQDQLIEIEKPLVRVERATQSALDVLSRAENQNILDWASEIPFQKHFKVAREKALPGTGTWLYQDDQFIDWHNCSRSQILWLHGSAGTGKSTLT